MRLKLWTKKHTQPHPTIGLRPRTQRFAATMPNNERRHPMMRGFHEKQR